MRGIVMRSRRGPRGDSALAVRSSAVVACLQSSRQREGQLRVYQGTPRRAYADVLRAIGAVLDRGGMRSVLLVEVEEGFIAQGHASTQTDRRNAWGSLTRVELHFWDADIAREMQSAVDRRGTAHVADERPGAFRLLGGCRYSQAQRDRPHGRRKRDPSALGNDDR